MLLIRSRLMGMGIAYFVSFGLLRVMGHGNRTFTVNIFSLIDILHLCACASRCKIYKF